MIFSHCPGNWPWIYGQFETWESWEKASGLLLENWIQGQPCSLNSHSLPFSLCYLFVPIVWSYRFVHAFCVRFSTRLSLKNQSLSTKCFPKAWMDLKGHRCKKERKENGGRKHCLLNCCNNLMLRKKTFRVKRMKNSLLNRLLAFVAQVARPGNIRYGGTAGQPASISLSWENSRIVQWFFPVFTGYLGFLTTWTSES